MEINDPILKKKLMESGLTEEQTEREMKKIGEILDSLYD